MTQEITQQLISWLNYKYRSRRVCYKNKQTGKTITEIRTPEKEDTDLIFALYQNKEAPNPNNLYFEFGKFFAKTLDSMGKGDREDGGSYRRRDNTSFIQTVCENYYL